MVRSSSPVRPSPTTPLSGMVAQVGQVSEASMLDTVTVTRATGRGAFDPSSMTYTGPGTPTTVYTGPGRVTASPLRGGFQGVVGDAPVAPDDVVVTIPVAATPPVAGDQVTVDASTDTATVGRVFRVTTVRWSSSQAERVLVCQDVTEVADHAG